MLGSPVQVSTAWRSAPVSSGKIRHALQALLQTRALRPALIHRKTRDWPSNSVGVQATAGAKCHSRLLAVTATLRQQDRDFWSFLEQTWVAHHPGGELVEQLAQLRPVHRIPAV